MIKKLCQDPEDREHANGSQFGHEGTFVFFVASTSV